MLEELKKKILNDKQERFITADMQFREETEKQEKIVEGYAANFEVYTKIRDFWGDEYYEVIERGAFDGAIDDVVLNFNHNNSVVLGRTTSGTLSLLANDIGLRFVDTFPNTTQANDVYELVKRKDISQCSFAFIISDADWSEKRDGLPVCRIKKFKRIFDVSLVTFPAYPGTLASARSEDLMLRQQLIQRLERNLLINKIKRSDF